MTTKEIKDMWNDTSWYLCQQKCKNCVGYNDCDHKPYVDTGLTIKQADRPEEFMHCCNFIDKNEDSSDIVKTLLNL